MSFVDKIWEMAQKDKKKIVLPEGDEERNLKAAELIKKNAIAEIVLVGDEEKIKANAKTFGVNIEGIEVINPETSDKTAKYAEAY